MNLVLSCILAVVVMALQTCVADVGDYSDTDAVIMNADLPDLSDAPVANVEIYTSHAYRAGTDNTIVATFFGQFAVSGPHDVNSLSLVAGQRSIHNVTLDRPIGDLQRVLLENYGHDGWLMKELIVVLGDLSHQLGGASQWLDSKQSDAQRGFTDGREPNVQDLGLTVAPRLMWSVMETNKIYTPTGSLGYHP
jgi:hypothetical protein